MHSGTTPENDQMPVTNQSHTNGGENVAKLRKRARCLRVLPLLLICCLLQMFFPGQGKAETPGKPDSDLLDRYDPGLPDRVDFEWSFPTGFSIGINGGHQIRLGESQDDPGSSASQMNLFPLAFLMEYPLLQTDWFRQSVGLGLGPYFFHQGPVPIHLLDFDVTCGSTYYTEWVTSLFQNLRLNLRMKYTHALRSTVETIRLGGFHTWIGLDFLW